MPLISAFVAGILFGTGLLLSRMSNPANVLAFLDVAGNWRPSLLYTMAAAVAVAFPVFWQVRRSQRSWLGLPVASADRFRLDLPLIAGSAIFGIGWGLSGICPGPALLLLSRADRGAIIFAIAMAMGMLAADSWRRRTRVAPQNTAGQQLANRFPRARFAYRPRQRRSTGPSH
jgi:uncharacterized membrane protein YedE/YeeE